MGYFSSISSQGHLSPKNSSNSIQSHATEHPVRHGTRRTIRARYSKTQASCPMPCCEDGVHQRKDPEKFEAILCFLLSAVFLYPSLSVYTGNPLFNNCSANFRVMEQGHLPIGPLPEGSNPASSLSHACFFFPSPGSYCHMLICSPRRRSHRRTQPTGMFWFICSHLYIFIDRLNHDPSGGRGAASSHHPEMLFPGTLYQYENCRFFFPQDLFLRV